MNNLGFNQQVFILNGEPVIIQRNSNANNSVSSIIDSNSITLQSNSVHESNSCNVSEQNISSKHQLEDINSENLISSIQDTNNGNKNCNDSEYVTYVGDSDEDETSTIHLTLEQAAELGLHFDTNDESKLTNNYPVVTSHNQIIDANNKRLSSFNLFNKNSMITNNEDNHELELSVFNGRKLINYDRNCKNIEEDTVAKETVSLENGYKTPTDEPVLENINIEDSNQHLTLIPHFMNGTITYSVQINGNSRNEPVKKSNTDAGNKNFLNATSKNILQNSVASSLNDNEFSDTIKPFTTCSDLTSFVESNLDSTSNSEVISTSARLIDTATQNVMSTNRNVTILPSSIINDSATKLSSNNFTSLSDIIKCTENGNNVLGLTNYQHITLSHILNNSNKIQQNDKSFQSCTPIIANIITNNNSTSVNNVISSADNGVLGGMKNNVALLKNSVCSDNTLLLSTGTNKTNFTVANNGSGNSILIPISIDSKSTMNPTTTVIPAVIASNVNNDNQPKCISTINEDDLSSLIHIRSTSSASSIVRNNIMNVAPVQRNDPSSNSNINVRLSSLNSVASSNLKMNKTLVSRGTLPSGALNELNQNCLNITSTPVAESSLNGNTKGNQQTVTQHLSLISSLAAVTTSSITCTTTVTSTTTACSTNISNLTPAIANANSASVNTSLPVTPTVKSVKTTTGCILPKEVSAALSKLPLLNNSSKPLGSSENPIQLVQQGHTFHSAQALTDEQLKQITTVLQQNNLSTNVPAKNILYDAETNTKIIYRVVYPEEFDLKEASMSGDEINGKGRKRGRPNKSHIKDPGGNTQDENNTTKRKQPLPRTRSGRLSRPPRYMVRDYKRIRRSELDDSEGAYSDYQSDHEEENPSTDKNLLPGLLLPQKRNISSTFRCPTCNKIYLGYRRMAHHFDKYSDHGTEEYLLRLKKACENKQITYNAPLNGSGDSFLHSNVNSETMIFNGSVDNDNASSNNPVHMVTPTTVMSASAMINKITSTVAPSENATINQSASLSDNGKANMPNSNNLVDVNRNVARIGIGIGFGKRRGRKKNGRVTSGGGVASSMGNSGSVPPISQHPASPISGQMDSEQLKTRLKELLELCDVSELVQIAGPAVCRVLSTWELLMLRIDSLDTKQNRISALCDEIKDISNRFKELANSLFQPVDSIVKNTTSNNNYSNNNCSTFQMDDKILSDFFGVPCGVYKINESLLGTDKINKDESLRTSLISNTNSDGGINSMVTLNKESVNTDSDSLTLPSMKSLEESTRCNINRGLDCEDANSSTNLNNEQLDTGDVNRSDNVPSLTSGQFLLTNESGILCDDRGTSLDDSVDQIVNEQLKNLTSSPQNHHHHQEDLCKVEVDELMKNFSVLDHHHHRSHHISHESHHQSGIVRMRSHTDPLDPSEDDLMDGFTSITNQRTHVSASTEDLIKSLENFGSELHNSTCDDDTSRQGFINANDSFNDRVVGVSVVNNVVDTLDFDVLSQDFHHSTNVNQQ